MHLALELGAQQITLVGLVVSAIAGCGYAWIQKRKGERYARVAKALGASIRTAAADVASHKPTIDAIVDGAYAFAAELNVAEQHVDEHLGELASKDST